ncbi:hypothetical protein [Pseudescherichia vulneris]|uniref:hypothetical protein n=1 Tax=Pseudescherichia vulneris TaxID=566 RepID=UPI0028D5AD10|nr:hypothetical protein [Pseudescherichia vulneris]
MNFEFILLFIMVFLFIILILLNTFNVIFFKINQDNYNALLAEYCQKGLDLDLITKIAFYLGHFADLQKIVWFVLLYKGVRMKYTKERYVHPEAYQFVQSLPDEKIGWILKLFRLYMIGFAIVIFLFLDVFILLSVYKS